MTAGALLAAGAESPQRQSGRSAAAWHICESLGRGRSASRRATADRGDESAAAILIDVVADKTGYPAAVLDLDMQLDADLGIDSIKRVEILSALQDRLPGLPALKPEQLGSFRSSEGDRRLRQPGSA